jgi:capsular polysaccharide biosynthesis protein
MDSSDDKTARCSHCGYPLSPTYVGPCPKCGKTGKSIAVHIVENLQYGLSARVIQDLVNTSGAGTFSAYNIPAPNWWPEASNAIALDIAHKFEDKLPEILAQHDKETELKEKRLTNRARGISKELVWIVVGAVLGQIVVWLVFGR